MVFADDAARGIQPQTGPLPDALGGEERLEDAGLHVGRNAGPVVANLDQHAVQLVASAHPQLTLSIHSVDGVVDEISPDLVQLASISANMRQVGIVVPSDRYAGFQPMAQNRKSALEAVTEVNFLDGGLVHVGVLFNGAHQFRDAPGAGFDLTDQSANREQGSDADEGVAQHLVSNLGRQGFQPRDIHAQVGEDGRDLPGIRHLASLQPGGDALLAVALCQGIGGR